MIPFLYLAISIFVQVHSGIVGRSPFQNTTTHTGELPILGTLFKKRANKNAKNSFVCLAQKNCCVFRAAGSLLNCLPVSGFHMRRHRIWEKTLSPQLPPPMSHHLLRPPSLPQATTFEIVSKVSQNRSILKRDLKEMSEMVSCKCCGRQFQA